MIKRNISEKILKASEKLPVLTVTGPRQSGKTTLVKYLFKDYKYLNFENITTRDFAKQDIIGFFE